ncbi:hypothetical protein ACFL20_09960 [Spirochaetota bacterium]
MKNINFTHEAKKGLSTIPLTPLDLDPELKTIEVEGGKIELGVYGADKIEKIVFCTIMLHETSVLESTAMVWPDDNHNFPALWLNLTIVPSVMNVPIFDFVPMMDYVVWPEYAEKYIAPVLNLREIAMEILGNEVIDKAADLPSKSIYTLSPYKVVAKISDNGIEKVPEILHEYINGYIDIWRNSAPINDKNEKDFYVRKKTAVRELMKANDPGYFFMVNVFGEDMTRKVFNEVF